MTGPLQALLNEEQALKQKLKERRQSALAAGYERRSLLDAAPGESSASARRNGPRTSKEVRRASDAPVSASRSRLLRPTALSQMRRNSAEEVPQIEVKPEEKEETEEERIKWENFHHRSSIRLQEKEKYLESLRLQKEEQAMEGCTFQPQKSRSQKSLSAPSSGSSMFDRARKMEAKKEQRMEQIRQELFDKEMAQCSFQPQIVGDRGYDSNSRRNSPVAMSFGDRSYNTYSDRPSAGARLEAVPSPSYGDNLQFHASSLPMSNRFGPSRCTTVDEASEASEHWNGNDDDCSEEADDLTILPPGVGGSQQARSSEAPPRPPKMPRHTAPASQQEEEAQAYHQWQLRHQLLEDTLSPDPASAKCFQFRDDLTAQQDLPVGGSKASIAAVAGAVERMEALLLGDLSDLDDSSEEEGELDEMQQLGGKPRLGHHPRPPVSPSKGGG